MISLKKLIYSSSVGITHTDESANQVNVPVTSESARVLDAYKSALSAMSRQTQRAIPVLSDIIQSGLDPVIRRLDRSHSSETLHDSSKRVEQQLSLWADKAQLNQKESEQTIRELLHLVFETAETTGVRDEEFSREITELSDRLRTVAGLESLPVIRRSIRENAAALTDCVVRMADEGRESVRRLHSEIAEYRSRLLASERRALIDPLTGLCNRCGFEQHLETRVQSRQPFSLLVVDLNGFKGANDRYGHLVGDEILKQFAVQLKAQFPSEDIVARWGGDEFVGIVGGPPREAAVLADRVRCSVLGKYEITADNQTLSIIVDAALGATAWNGAESGLALFARADKKMYHAKEMAREACAEPAARAVRDAV